MWLLEVSWCLYFKHSPQTPMVIVKFSFVVKRISWIYRFPKNPCISLQCWMLMQGCRAKWRPKGHRKQWDEIIFEEVFLYSLYFAASQCNVPAKIDIMASIFCSLKTRYTINVGLEIPITYFVWGQLWQVCRLVLFANLADDPWSFIKQKLSFSIYTYFVFYKIKLHSKQKFDQTPWSIFQVNLLNQWCAWIWMR